MLWGAGAPRLLFPQLSPKQDPYVCTAIAPTTRHRLDSLGARSTTSGATAARRGASASVQLAHVQPGAPLSPNFPIIMSAIDPQHAGARWSQTAHERQGVAASV